MGGTVTALDHVDEGETAGGRRGQGFHLDPGFGMGAGLGEVAGQSRATSAIRVKMCLAFWHAGAS